MLEEGELRHWKKRTCCIYRGGFAMKLIKLKLQGLSLEQTFSKAQYLIFYL